MRQTSTPSAPMYAPTPKRVAPRRRAPTTTGAADSEADRAAEDGSDDRGRSDPEHIRPEDPGDRYREAEPEAETEPDRVPASHAAQCRERPSASLRSER